MKEDSAMIPLDWLLMTSTDFKILGEEDLKTSTIPSLLKCRSFKRSIAHLHMTHITMILHCEILLVFTFHSCFDKLLFYSVDKQWK